MDLWDFTVGRTILFCMKLKQTGWLNTFKDTLPFPGMQLYYLFILFSHSSISLFSEEERDKDVTAYLAFEKEMLPHLGGSGLFVFFASVHLQDIYFL